jgi:hypothetical protein
MKTKLTYLLVFLMIAVTGFSQKPKAFFGISAGLSSPQGDFASKEFDSTGAGFAVNGFNLNLMYAHRLTYNLGITGSLLFNAHAFDGESFKNQVSLDTLDFPLTAVPKNWGGFGIMGGPFLYFPLGEYFNIDIRTLIGLYSVYSPEVVVTGKQQNGENFQLRLLKYNGIGFSYNLGTTVRFKFGNASYLMLNADYFSSKPSFKDVNWLDNNGEIEYRTFKRDISLINLTVGLGYAL